MSAAKGLAEELAALCNSSRTLLANAGQALHDDVGPLLAAAGLKLQLLRMDLPDCAQPVNETLEILDQAMERVRALSQQLNSSPVRRGGLKNALLLLAEEHPQVDLSYAAAVRPPVQAAAMLYDAASAAVSAALHAKASRVRISVTGKAAIHLRVTDNGRLAGRARALAAARLLAEQSRARFGLTTGKSTIVSIRYALRSPTGG